jgi:hypothetical protein
MDKVWTLIRVFFRSGNSLTISSKKKNNYWLIPILVIGFLPLSFQIGFSAFSMTLFLQPIGAQSTVLHSGLISGAFVIFFFGLFYVLGVFYFSKDIEFILTLPLKAWQILSSKFVTVLVYEYLVMLVILLPFLIGYGLGIAAGPIYALYSALIFLVMPIIPLSLASMPILVIMRFTGFARNRDKFKYITGILALFLGIGVSIGMQRFAMVTYDETMIMEMLNGLTQTMEKISILIPGVNFAVKSLTEYNTWSGLLYLLLFFLSAGLIFLIFMALGKLLYFKGVIGINESSAKREKLDVESLNKNVYRKSIMNSYVLKEIRLLIRTPIYFLNCVMGNFLIPIFFIIPMVPVGKDQLPHLELTRTIARRFNERFAQNMAVFPEPQPLLSKAPLILGLDGSQKMSKSRNNAIMLSATEDETAQLIKKAKTDAQRQITYDPENRPEVSNLLTLISLSTGEAPEAIAERIGDGGGAQLKRMLTESLNDYLRPLRAKRKELEANMDYVRDVLKRGVNKAREIAEATLDEVRSVMNMEI